MADSVKTPYIHVNDGGEVYIIGEPMALEALGEMMVLKSKMGKNMIARFSDGVNPIIKIETTDDLEEEVK